MTSMPVPNADQYPKLTTAWYRWNPPERPKAGKTGKPGFWSFNHIEDGHAASATPADPFGRGWQSAKWRKRHGQLVAEGSCFGAPVVIIDTTGVFDGTPDS
jgi:hypothetical protein